LHKPDIEGLVSALETSDLLYREMRSIYEAFGAEVSAR
jgi:hypothetical protein